MPFMGQYDPQDWWPIDDAADVIDFGYQGHIFYSGVARGTEHIFKEALDRIVPRIQGGLYTAPGGPNVNDGDWGREQRMVRGSTTSVSFHNPGLALDINAIQNPMGIDPHPGEFCLPMNTGQLIADLDMEWGGDWSGRKDCMHIELHKTPAEVAAWNAARTGIPTPAVPVSKSGTGSTKSPPPTPKEEDMFTEADRQLLQAVNSKLDRVDVKVWGYALPVTTNDKGVKAGAGRILANLGIQSGPIAVAVTAVKNVLTKKVGR